jgi:hypothetical protein
MRLIAIAVALVLLTAGVAAAEERERGFFDAYTGLVGLFESDRPEWKFADSSTVIGGRVGVWMNDAWGLSLRTWYFKTDAKEEMTSPSDLAFLGVSLELVGRWRLDERWAVYASIGPVMAITTLDLQRNVRGRLIEDDARSIAPGASAALGVEARVLPRLRGFAEIQNSLVYPSLQFSDRTISPRLWNLYGLVGARIPF